MKLVSIPAAAKIFDINAATVRIRVKSGAWPAYAVGERSIRIDIDEIKSLLRLPAKRERSGKKEPARTVAQ